MLAALLTAALWIGPAQSGSWYTPERSGEGFTLQVLADGSAAAIWFTYPPAGAAGQQAWIYMDGGRLEGDRIRFERAFTTRGPRFGAAFDPAQVQLQPWGSVEFRFTDCNAGSVTFAGTAGWGSGTRSLARLTAISELECGGKRRVTAAGARALDGVRQKSGAWFDPAHNGEGWVVEELPDGRALVYWFTYDANGEQAWTVGEAFVQGARLAVDANLRPVGTRFGTAFDASQVQRAPWGGFTIDFASCNQATLAYASTDAAFGTGTLRPVRLSALAGAACVDGTPSVPAGGTWSAGAPMPVAISEVATAVHEGSAYIAGGVDEGAAFLRYDLARGEWETLPPLPGARHHASATAVGGEILVSDGYAYGSQSNAAGARYSVAQRAWTVASDLPPVAASGAVTLAGYAWFADADGALRQYDPRTRAFRLVPGDARAPRDHSQLVAFQGELWLIGGRTELVSESALVSIFDPAAERWRAGPSLRTARAGFAAASSNDMLLVAGGEVLSGGLRLVISMEGVAAGQDAWTLLGNMPTPVHGVGGAIHGNAFFALGGSSRAGRAVNPGVVQVYRW